MTGKRSLAISWLPFPALIHATDKWSRNLGRRMQNCAVGWGGRTLKLQYILKKGLIFKINIFFYIAAIRNVP